MITIAKEGVGRMHEFIEKYLKLKAELKDSEIKSIAELTVLYVLTENKQGLTKREITSKTDITTGTFATLSLRLIKAQLICTKTDETDVSKNVLRRQIYMPTQAGLDLMERLKRKLQ